MNENTSQPQASSGASRVNRNPTTIGLGVVGDMSWRILVIAVGYMLASTIAALVLDRPLELGGLGVSLMSGILVGVALGPIAARVQASGLSHWAAWFSVLFFNTLSLAIEGAFFAPTLSPIASLPVPWTAYMLLESALTAGLVAWLCGQSVDATKSGPPHQRA